MSATGMDHAYVDPAPQLKSGYALGFKTSSTKDATNTPFTANTTKSLPYCTVGSESHRDTGDVSPELDSSL